DPLTPSPGASQPETLQTMIQDVMEEFYTMPIHTTGAPLSPAIMSPMIDSLMLHPVCDISLGESYSALLSNMPPSPYSPTGTFLDSPPLTPTMISPIEAGFGAIRRSSQSQNTTANSNNKKVRTHHCKNCSSSFFSKYHLRRHEKIHFPEAHQYSCPISGCRFKSYRSDNMKNHVETHRNRLARERNDIARRNIKSNM
ncbi:MAG: hypothetical protein SGCHY_004194, partial [Lobulomycetales sp.]